MMDTDSMITDEERERISTWTEVDQDLTDCDPSVATVIRNSRIAAGRVDSLRSVYWQVPEGIDVIADIPYLKDDDGARAHKLDLYLPHDAMVRAGRSLPVYIDIHGGGFTYGYKELNRNFNTHLAAQGFAVFSVNYGLGPKTDFLGQLADLEQAMSWIAGHLGDYPVDPRKVFITGDSAGGTLGLYIAAIEGSADMARAVGVQPSGLDLRGAAFVSGLFDITPFLRAAGNPPAELDESTPVGSLLFIARQLFDTASQRLGKWADLGYMVSHAVLPPILLNTSNDDFIESESLRLATCLSVHGKDFELHDVHAKKGETLVTSILCV